jgi:hypothetical protein
MKSFRDKYPGLTEEQLRIKYKLWEKEKEREKQLLESLRKKDKNPFREDDDEGESGLYDGALDIGGNHGIVSDAVLVGATVTFVYSGGDGLVKKAITDSDGRFLVPRSFGSGRIIVSGGVDAVNGLPYKGEFCLDAEFFHKYSAVTPLTHIANHIWQNTPTRVPEEAMNLVLDYLPDFSGIPVGKIDPVLMFNEDHVKLTLDGVEGAKNIQAINTIIEVHADLISSLKANNEEEIEGHKKQTYLEIGNALLTKINGQENTNYIDDVFKFHSTPCDKKHENCCNKLISHASSIIAESIDKDPIESTSDIQAINLAVKTEWSQKALEMTNDPNATPNKVWNSIENKTMEELITQINIPV